MDTETLLNNTKQLLVKADSLDADTRVEFLRVFSAVLTCFTSPRSHGVFVWTENEETLRVHGVNATHLDTLVLLRTAHDSFLDSFQQEATTATQNGEVH
jgi:hypothetical protein